VTGDHERAQQNENGKSHTDRQVSGDVPNISSRLRH